MGKRALVCGTGNTAHVLAALLLARGGFAVRVFTLCAEKAARWRETSANRALIVTEDADGESREIVGATGLEVSTDPACARECDVVFTAVTAFSTPMYLEALSAYIEPHAVIVGMPGQGGYEFEVKQHLGDKPVVIVNFESAPWVCRVMTFARHVHISGTKAYLAGAMRGNLSRGRLPDPFGSLREVIGTKTQLLQSASLLATTLMSVNGYSHPPIMYGAWRDWDGRPIGEPPPFYGSVDTATANLMTAMSDEVLAISDAITAQHPEQDLSAVIPMLRWDQLAYAGQISDPSSQLTALRTNRAYATITHPMRRHEAGGWTPDFSSRFLTEDVPFGLVPIRGIAQLAGVQTPHIDRVLRWSERQMEKQYLQGEALTGRDIATTSCPQRYGHRALEEIL